VLSISYISQCGIGRQTIPDLERHLLEQFELKGLDLQNVCAAVTDGGKNFVGATQNQLSLVNQLLDKDGDNVSASRVYACHCVSQAEMFNMHIVCICHRLNTALLKVFDKV
jgi:hypothetical protein